MRAWAALFAAIALEVTGTLSLKLSTQGGHLLTYVLLAGSYWLLSQAFRQIPVAVAFAVWEACGLLLLTLLAAALLGEYLRPVQWLALGGLLLGAALLHRGTRGGSS